jgi:hypothetical protein
VFFFCNGEWKRRIISTKEKEFESDKSIEVCKKYVRLMTGAETPSEMSCRPLSDRVSKMENECYKIVLYFSLVLGPHPLQKTSFHVSVAADTMGRCVHNKPAQHLHTLS